MKKLLVILVLILTITLSGCTKEEYYTQDEVNKIVTELEDSFDAQEMNNLNERVLEIESELRDFERFEYEDLIEFVDLFDDWEDVINERITNLEKTIYVDISYQYEITLRCGYDSCEIKIYQPASPVIDENYISIDIRQVDDNTLFFDIDRANTLTHIVNAQVQLEEESNFQSYMTFATYMYYSYIEYGITYNQVNDLYFNQEEQDE